MIANHLLATASSAVYQAHAMRQADAAARAEARAASDVAGQNTQPQELRKSERGRQSPALSFGDIYASQISLSSLAFVMIFGIAGERMPIEEDVAGQGYRQYAAAQQWEDAPSTQIARAEDDVFELSESLSQEVLPPLRFNASSQQKGGANEPYMNTALGGSVLDEFALARISYQKATEFRERAFTSPAGINLLG